MFSYYVQLFNYIVPLFSFKVQFVKYSIKKHSWKSIKFGIFNSKCKNTVLCFTSCKNVVDIKIFRTYFMPIKIDYGKKYPDTDRGSNVSSGYD